MVIVATRYSRSLTAVILRKRTNTSTTARPPARIKKKKVTRRSHISSRTKLPNSQKAPAEKAKIAHCANWTSQKLPDFGTAGSQVALPIAKESRLASRKNVKGRLTADGAQRSLRVRRPSNSQSPQRVGTSKEARLSRTSVPVLTSKRPTSATAINPSRPSWGVWSSTSAPLPAMSSSNHRKETRCPKKMEAISTPMTIIEIAFRSGAG